MKNTFFLFIALLIIPFLGFTQTINDLDYISPFNEDVAAIKKGDQWAFINKQGDIVVDFRNDLIMTKTSNGNFPIFNNDRCQITTKKDGVTYFGYIDKTGKTVIEPQFLNAASFNNNTAVAILLVIEKKGKNKILDKDLVYYKYFEVTIDTNGNVKDYLTKKGVYIALDKKFLAKPPMITTQLISDNLYTILNKNKKWSIKKMNE